MTYDEFLNFLDQFEEIQSFNKKIQYANQNLQRIGSGTGRIVYDIDGTKVFKIAKNAKGVAQNEAEANAGRYPDTHHIVTAITEFDNDGAWIIAEKVKKVNEARIKQLTGISSLKDLHKFFTNYSSRNKGGRDIFGMDAGVEEEMNENEFVGDLMNFASNYGQNTGDWGRASSYGEVLRDGQPSIVLTDYGLNDEVYDTYYSGKPKQQQRYRMYELYNAMDGNDDILGDLPPQDAVDTRRGMWAQMPYGVGDGDDVINEDFVDFTLERNAYPNQPLSAMPYMLERFHECMNNLKKTLDYVPQKQKFYENLLAMQNYLTEQNYYSGEPLEKEEYDLNEASPQVQPFTLENKNYAIELANALSEKVGIGQLQYLAGGSNGHAFTVDNTQILKLTADISEADAAIKTVKHHPKYLAKIYTVFKVVDTEKQLAFYAILQENILNKPRAEFFRLNNIIDTIEPAGQDFVRLIKMMRKATPEELRAVVGQLMTDKPEANISDADRTAAHNYMLGLINIQEELRNFGIKSDDYSNPDNLGYEDGILKFFDIGGYRAPAPQLAPEDTIYIPEGVDMLSEELDRGVADNIANQVVTKFGYGEPKYIASGNFGAAYDIGNNIVLKVTKDRSEANENLRLIGKPLKYIAQPCKVFSIKPQSGETELYVIILEKLRTDYPAFKAMTDRMNFAFGKIMNSNYGDVIDYFVNSDKAGMINDDIDEEKIKKYMSRNPQDAEFFNKILKIGEEANKYGVESVDYINPANLGYKPDGTLGFFDVGFGNYFFTAQNQPEEIEVNEDSTSKFSTDDSIGQDGFPPYNQGADDSPMIQNDLNANVNIEEDLEYNHVVGDATEDKFMMSERVKSSMAGSSSVEVKQKCRLAGNGNTSTPCNQGDISNLNIKSLDEAQNPEFLGYNNDVDAIEQQEKSYLKRVSDNYVKLNRKYLQPYLTPEEMRIVDVWIASDFKTGDRDDDKDAYTVRMKGVQALQAADPETYAKFSAEVKRYLDTSTKVRKFFLNKKFALDKKYPGDERFGMAGDVNVSEVSHFTTTEGAIGILDDGYIMDNPEGGVATTSNKNLVKDIKPVFYHPQSSGYEGVTYKNLSTQFVLDFLKIKADGLKFRKGGESRGTHFGEDEIRIYPEDSELDIYRYLKKVIIDPTKNKDPRSLDKLINVLKNKNIKYYIKGEESDTLTEEVDAKDVVSNISAIKTVINGKRDVGFVEMNKTIYDKLAKHGIGIIIARMITNSSSMAIIYRDKGKAMRLYDIVKRNNGYLTDRNAEEAREIGRLLGYKEASIEEYINRKYGKKVPVLPEKSPEDYNDLDEDSGQSTFRVPNYDHMGWITPDNTFVESNPHLRYLMQIYPKIKSQDELYKKAFGDGLTRIIFDKGVIGNILDIHAPTEERLREILLGAYSSSFGGESQIYGDAGSGYHYRFTLPTDKEELNNFLYSNKRVRQMMYEDSGQCQPIKITPDILEFLQKFGSDEELLRAGGIPTDLLDKAAWGFDDTLNKLMPKQLSIKWTDDLENVKWEIKKKGISDVQFAKSVNLAEPIDVSFDGKNFFIEDGHHRYYAASVLNKPLNVNLEIKANPIEVLGGDMGYDEFHRCIWKQAHNQNTGVMNEAQLISLKDLPFKQEVEQLGGKIFSVGGAVRDEFLGKDSKDLDVLITGIPMDKLEQLLKKYGVVNAVGKSFGVLKFKPQGATEDIDIAIPRTETATGEGGHQGFDVKSDHALPIEKDLERRDFTINAIAKDINGNIVDPYGGQEDLKNKIIRVVNPQAFSDDPLRMLRAVQFASRFGFTIEPETMKMIQDNAQRVNEIAPERILTEFDKIIKKGDILTGVELLISTGLHQQIFGGVENGVNPLFAKVRTMGEFIYLLAKNIVANPAEFYLQKFATEDAKRDKNYKEIKALEMAFDSAEATSLIEARSIAHNMFVTFPASLESQILPEVVRTAAQELLQGKYPKTVNELVLNGNDLGALGLQGKAIGDMQKALLLKVYADKVRNSREELQKLVKPTGMVNENKIPERIEYGCLMLFLDVPIWSKITSVIDKDDLYDVEGYGIENEPHTTILYGFHDSVTADDVFGLYELNVPLKPIEIAVEGISVFENPEFDVVKFEVSSKALKEINGIMKSLPNTSKFPDYNAHITIGYVKKGEGKKYVKQFEKPRMLKGDELVFTWKGHKGKEGGQVMKLEEKGLLKEFSYPELTQEKRSWNINGVEVDVNFFVHKYDEWNNQGGENSGYRDPSVESVLEFLQNNYEDFSNDMKLRRELLWALTDRNVLD